MSVRFSLDGQAISAEEGETIWSVAARLGTHIPHLCHRPESGYRPDGNCRACMVEIEGERTLQPSCKRVPTEGMVVKSATPRAEQARRMVMELLLADQPSRDNAHDAISHFWQEADTMALTQSRFPPRAHEANPDLSHPAMAVMMDACIACGLCVRACREVQVNDVIGMALRGADVTPVFDLSDPMGDSTCVACGECVQACPTGALMPQSIVDPVTHQGTRAADESVDSVCPFCGVGCQISFKLRDGKIAYVEGRDGPANENRLCVKGRFGFDYIDHPERLTVPLIRKPDAPKGLNVDPRNPWTHFRAATWEEALARAAGGFDQLRTTQGGRSIAGFGSAKGSNEEAYLFQKLIRTAFLHNNVDHCTRLCHASSVTALMEGIGSGAVTTTFDQALEADVIIVIGSNPTENHPVAATYIKQAAKKGAKLIVMDPRGMALKKHTAHMLQFRPGSDVAMLNAMMHVIVEEGLFNSAYIAAHTDGFERLRQHLSRFTPEAMSAQCGIAPEKLREVARLYATAPRAIIFWGMGVSQHVHGTDNARALISLALMCGQTGRPGTGLHPLRGQNNVQGASDAGLIPMMYPDYARVGITSNRTRFENLWHTTLDPEPGLTVVEIIQAIARQEIRGLYVMGENPAMSDPDLDHVRAALSTLDHLVVQDIFLTETAMFADVVLPASAWPEKTGTVTNTNRQIQMGRPALDPPGAARRDFDILVAMGQQLGLAWNYTHPRDVFTEMKKVMRSLDHISWDRLEREDAVTYPCQSDDAPGQKVVFADRFPTATGRARFVPAEPMPPGEWPDEAYPMILTTGRELEHWHTGAMTRRATVLDALEPAATVSLNPDTMRRLGILAGETVRLVTRRGSITLAAREEPAMQRDMVFVPFAYVEAAANILTSERLDPDAKIPEFKLSAVRVEKVESVDA